VGDSAALTLAEFTARHPWPENLQKLGKPLEWLWSFDIEASPDDLWVHIIDTSRLNRALGLSPIQFEERDGVLYGRAKNGGIRQEWIERPWDWVSGQYVHTVREYTRGFVYAVRGIYWIEPLGADRVRYYVYFGWVPRGVLGRVLLRLGMPGVRRGYERVLRELERDIARARPAVFEPPQPALPDGGPSRLASIRDALVQDGFDAALVERLVEYVRTGDELDLYRIQALSLAREWSVDEDEVLRLCLHATRQGLLDMSWDVICPHCRGVRQEARSLGDVPSLGACEVCDIDFSTDKANAIEITFHVHASIRDIPKVFFCSAEPSSKLHIKLQYAVAPGQRTEVRTRLEPGRYRMRLKGAERVRFLDVVDADDDHAAADDSNDADGDALTWRAEGPRDVEDTDEVTAGPDPVLALHNDGDDDATFVIESAMWADGALRPARLFNLQEFRDLFSEEYLAAGVQLAVGEQTILFTDIVGSTRFYADRGDPAAFMEVKKHFTEIYEIVGRHHGAVVKTIGDAVMGSFSGPVDALAAAREIQRLFHDGRADTPIRVRVSLNTGSCIAVNLNSAIDYFGSTVNIAAKLQACAEAGEVSMSQAVLDSPGVRDYLDEVGAALRETSLSQKGTSEELAAAVWTIWQPAPSAATPPDVDSGSDGDSDDSDDDSGTVPGPARQKVVTSYN
jgi:class 3 adenylate cyclase